MCIRNNSVASEPRDRPQHCFLASRQLSQCCRAIAQAVSRRPYIAESMWDLWWINSHWDRFLSELFVFHINVISPWFSILIYQEVKNKRSVVNRSSETVSDPIDITIITAVYHYGAFLCSASVCLQSSLCFVKEATA